MSALEGRSYDETRDRLMRDPIIQEMAKDICRALHDEGMSMSHLFHVTPGEKAEAWTCRHEFMGHALETYKAKGGKVPCHIGGPAESIKLLVIKDGEGELWPAAAEPAQADSDADDFESAEEFISYLRGTLISDLRESGRDATADDFETAIRFMTPGNPKFTGQFDLPDYEAFYLEVTSKAGVDESITAEEAARIVVSKFDPDAYGVKS